MRSLSRLMYRLYGLRMPKLRRVVLALAKRFDGGQVYSKTLRAIFSKYHNIEVGKYSYGSCFDPCAIASFTKIGRYCSFAENVYIYNANHPLGFRSMHPFFYNPAMGVVESEQISRRRIEIGNDVWVGQNAIILASVTKIGDGAVIGAGTVVTKDVPDFAVVVGNPGKVLKYRFSDETIRKLKKERWWDKDIDELRANLADFTQSLEQPQAVKKSKVDEKIVDDRKK